MEEQDNELRLPAGAGYPVGQLAKAFVTAATHQDAATRERAERRMHRWRSMLDGMAHGTLSIGSRQPVKDLPVWVTPEVVRGGFATGQPAAGGELRDHEYRAAQRAGVPAERRALFAYHLTEPGLTELYAALDSGRYRVELPEQAALLVVAWLARAGDVDAALDLVETLTPLADRLTFAPVPADAPGAAPSIVWRESVGQVRDRVAERRTNERIHTQYEALTVWNPFADEVLTLWLETVEAGRVAEREPDGWLDRAGALLDRYHVLAGTHRRCGKHRRPGENLAILLDALAERAAGRPLAARQLGLLRHAVESMVRRRGRPGSPEHATLRERQRADAALPTHHAIARVVVARLAALPQDLGTDDVDALTAPVRADETTPEVPAGTPIPESIQRVVRLASAGTIDELVVRGAVPSAEVLAQLVPQIAATATATAYLGEPLRALMAANYRAFRNRRSLLLANLARQVRIDELPWVRAVEAHRAADAQTRGAARTALVHLAELALIGFPATVLPNPLVAELSALASEADLDLPWVEELAADIFAGRFSAKFLTAAKLAGDLLDGTLYARYYGIDYAAVRELASVPDFDALCHDRAGVRPGGYSVAANGTVIEQAQILTTHNLATLVGPIGVEPTEGWDELARRAFARSCRLVGRLDNDLRPLSTVKDAAYAWRHLIFYLSLLGTQAQDEFIAYARGQLADQPSHVDDRLTPVLDGLADPDANDRRLLGWTADEHWMLDDAYDPEFSD